MKFPTFHTSILRFLNCIKSREHERCISYSPVGLNKEIIQKIALVIQTCVCYSYEKKNIYVHIYFILHVYRKLAFSHI